MLTFIHLVYTFGCYWFFIYVVILCVDCICCCAIHCCWLHYIPHILLRSCLLILLYICRHTFVAGVPRFLHCPVRLHCTAAPARLNFAGVAVTFVVGFTLCHVYLTCWHLPYVTPVIVVLDYWLPFCLLIYLFAYVYFMFCTSVALLLPFTFPCADSCCDVFLYIVALFHRLPVTALLPLIYPYGSRCYVDLTLTWLLVTLPHLLLLLLLLMPLLLFCYVVADCCYWCLATLLYILIVVVVNLPLLLLRCYYYIYSCYPVVFVVVIMGGIAALLYSLYCYDLPLWPLYLLLCLLQRLPICNVIPITLGTLYRLHRFDIALPLLRRCDASYCCCGYSCYRSLLNRPVVTFIYIYTRTLNLILYLPRSCCYSRICRCRSPFII